MYNNDYMYAIERSDDYLAHYGVRGMKWGVRKARQLGLNTGRGAKALGRQYAKAQKKLAKLDKAAANSKKYVRRAALMGAGAAAAGGLAAAGTSGVSSAMAKIGAHGGKAMIGAGKGISRAGAGFSKGLYNLGKATGNSTLKRIGAHGGNAMIGAGNAISRAGTGVSTGMYTGSKAVRAWGKSDSLSRALRRPMITGAVTNGGAVGKGLNKAQGALRGVSNNTIARIGAGAVGAGLAAGAARNAYKAATAQKKAAKFRSEMNKAFAGTKYANGGGNSSSRPRQGKKRRRS